MSEHKLENIKKIYFVGIGGTSMSGLALMSKINGFEVSGSDMRGCSYTEKLEKYGIRVFIGHDGANVPEDADLVVYSAAIKQSNPELVRAGELGIPTMERSFFLGLMTKLYPETIGIAGTHGKTTTSSLAALLLYYAGLDPSVSIGGTLEQIGGNSRVGNSDYFVIEACEFVDSFLHSQHRVGVILNIEEDHLDYFTGGIEQIKTSFHKFAAALPQDGLLLANGDDENTKAILTDDIVASIQTFGIGEENLWHPANIVYDKFGKPTFDVYKGSELYGTFSLNIPGEHNVSNSLSVIAIGDFLGIDKFVIQRAFLEFSGAKRRFEKCGEVASISVFQDYAHHPTELKVTIDACLNYEHNRLWVVFQPHTYSRTYFLFEEFVGAMQKADRVILNDIYSDREDNDWHIFSEDIAKEVKFRYNVPTIVFSEFSDIAQYIASHAEEGDFVLVAGSQSINLASKDILAALKDRFEE